MSFSGKSGGLNNQVLQLVFYGSTPAWLLNARVWVALHTGNLTDASSQTTSEATYTGYARVGVLKDTSHWTLNTGTQKVSNTLIVQFPTCSGGSNTITYVSLGSDATGAGQVYYWGALDTSVSVTTGKTPRFEVGDLVIQEI